MWLLTINVAQQFKIALQKETTDQEVWGSNPYGCEVFISYCNKVTWDDYEKVRRRIKPFIDWE